MCGAMALCVPLVRCGFRYGAVSAKIMQCVYYSIAQCCRYGPVYSFLGSAMLSFWLGECRYSAVHTDMVHWFELALCMRFMASEHCCGAVHADVALCAMFHMALVCLWHCMVRFGQCVPFVALWVQLFRCGFLCITVFAYLGY